MKAFFFAVVIMVTFAQLSVAEEGAQEGGLFSEGSFFSDAISSVSDKLNKVTSGNQEIFDDNAKGIDKDMLEYDGNPLGRNRGAANRPRKNHNDSPESAY